MFHNGLKNRIRTILCQSHPPQKRKISKIKIHRAPSQRCCIQSHDDGVTSATFCPPNETFDQFIRFAPVKLKPSWPLSHRAGTGFHIRSEEHTSELQSRGHLVCRLLLAKKTK